MADDLRPIRWGDDASPRGWLETLIRAAVGGVVPGGGAALTIADEIAARWRRRAEEFAEQVLEGIDPQPFVDRLRQDERFGDLFAHAVQRVASVSWEANRRAMGRVVRSAYEDRETDIDASERLLLAMTELTEADFRTLALLRDATGEDDKAVSPEGVPGLALTLPALIRAGTVETFSAWGTLAYRPTPLGLMLLVFVALDGDGTGDTPDT